MKWVQRLIILACALIVVAHVPVRTDRGYFCDYTCSIKEWTTWFGLVETDYRYRKSKLEAFWEAKHASGLEHKWVSFNGTTTFLLAGKLFAHRTPGPLFYLPRGLFDQWCDAVSEDEKLKLYHLLRNGDEKAIQAVTEEMVEVVMKQLRFPLE
jgi:hypothetical protein